MINKERFEILTKKYHENLIKEKSLSIKEKTSFEWFTKKWEGFNAEEIFEILNIPKEETKESIKYFFGRNSSMPLTIIFSKLIPMNKKTFTIAYSPELTWICYKYVEELNEKLLKNKEGY